MIKETGRKTKKYLLNFQMIIRGMRIVMVVSRIIGALRSGEPSYRQMTEGYLNGMLGRSPEERLSLRDSKDCRGMGGG